MKNQISKTIEDCSKKFYFGEYGEVQVTQEDDVGKWLFELVKDLHNEQLPNNWVFLTARRIVDEFVETCSRLEEDATEAETVNALQESIPELADTYVSAYNGPRWHWFKEHGTVYDDYIIEVIQDGESSLIQAIGIAQAKVIEDMARAILHALLKRHALQVA